jgi:hypothetical protein
MKIKFWILVAIAAALVSADIISTYINTPDLALEVNPWVAELGLGWVALLVANAISLALQICLFYYAFVKYKTRSFAVNNEREYVSQLLYNRPDKFKWCFYKTPKNWQPIYAMFAYCLSGSLLASRASVVLGWVAYYLDFQGFEVIARFIPFGRLDVMVTLVTFIVLIFTWFKKEYQKSKKSASGVEL